MFVDFKMVRTLATLDQVSEWLGLKTKNHRCQCPIKLGEQRELVLNHDKQLFNCFGCKSGGDIIQLCAHVRQISVKDAALEIQKHFHGYEPAKRGLPATGLDYLVAKDPHVQALGIGEKSATELGVGWAPRGTMIRHVLFPLRDSTGKLIGYLGYNPITRDLKLPSNLRE